MSKKQLRYRLFLILSLVCCYLQLPAQDSLYVDDSKIESRDFDDLSNKYNSDDYIYERSVETSGWWSRLKQWFRDLFNIKSGSESDKYIDLAFWICASIIFLLVIFFLFKAIINKEGQWIFGKSSDKTIIPVTDIESNLHVADFRSLIADAEKTDNYRLAIRYYYLWLLKKLSHAEIIEYDVEKTNSDYHHEISSREVKEEFSYTSYLYNYIWYGEFDVNNTQFNKAKRAFNNFLNSIKA